MAPILILMFGFHPAVAVGTDLWFAAITKSAGGIVHHRLGSTRWPLVGLLALGSVPAAALNTIFNSTAAELLYLNKREQLDHVLRLVTRLIGPYRLT